jgi:pimeloyl-ACP methyl ester carboxylesterase
VVLVLEVIVWAIVGLALLVTISVLAAFLAGRWFFVERDPDEIHFARTQDGWRIAIARYRAQGANGAGEPVLLCHGVASNHYGLDLTDELSLARALSRAGFDAWLVELRGRGLSTRPRLFGAKGWDWSFDEYVEKDAPAAISAVLSATGRSQLHWVGHSLGAIVGYAVLADPVQAARIRSAVAIAGPVSYRFQQKYLYDWPLKNLRFVKHAFLMRLLAPLAGYWRPKILHNPENITGETIRRFLVNASASFSPNELLQYSDWIKNDLFRSIDHRRDYRKEMEKITTPTLFIAGNKDLLAPPPSVKDAHDLVASTDKRFVVASRGSALDANYGHMDLVVGRGAPKDIFPLVVEWLSAHAEQPSAG